MDCSRLRLESNLDEVAMLKRFRQPQQATSYRKSLQFAVGALPIPQHEQG